MLTDILLPFVEFDKLPQQVEHGFGEVFRFGLPMMVLTVPQGGPVVKQEIKSREDAGVQDLCIRTVCSIV